MRRWSSLCLSSEKPPSTAAPTPRFVCLFDCGVGCGSSCRRVHLVSGANTWGHALQDMGKIQAVAIGRRRAGSVAVELDAKYAHLQLLSRLCCFNGSVADGVAQSRLRLHCRQVLSGLDRRTR